MLITVCPMCRAEIEVTFEHTSNNIMTCPKCNYSASWAVGKNSFNIGLPDLRMTATITPPPES